MTRLKSVGLVEILAVVCNECRLNGCNLATTSYAPTPIIAVPNEFALHLAF